MIKYYDSILLYLSEFSEVFNNRELASAIWICAIVIYLLFNKKTHQSVINMLKIAFCRKFIIAYICMLLYTGGTVYLLYLIGFWNIYLLKKTIMWFLFTAIVSVFRAVDNAKDFSYFKTMLKDYIKITLLIEFIVKFYTFSLLFELILLPVLSIIIMSSAILDYSAEFQNEKSKIIKRLFTFINIVLGWLIIIHAVSLAANDIKKLADISALKSLLLSPILSIVFLVFTYFFVLWCKYEEIFVRIPFGERKDTSLIVYLKFKIFMLCNLNLSRVNSFWEKCGLRVLSIKSKADVIALISYYKAVN